MKTRVLLMATLFLVGAGGCGNQAGESKKKPKRHAFKIEVEVTNTDSEPVPGAPVKLSGKTFGYTDKNGKFVGLLKERPGRKIELSVGKLEGYRYVDKHSVTETLELKKSLSGKGRKGVPVLLRAVAESTKKNYLVWIRAECDEETMEAADCRGLPVKREGTVVATTDRTGTAHVGLEERPGETMNLTVDTPKADPEDDESTTYEPEDPNYEIEFALEPRVYMVEAAFKDPKVKEAKEARKERTRARRRRSTGSSSSGSSRSGGGGSASSSGSESSTSSSGSESSTSSSSSSESGGDDGSSEGSSSGGDSSSGGKKDDGVIDLF